MKRIYLSYQFLSRIIIVSSYHSILMRISCRKCTLWSICQDSSGCKFFFLFFVFRTAESFIIFIHHRFGPLKHHWTMRYESKHSYFKRLSNYLGNYINICHTLAMRHEQLSCYNRLDDSTFSIEIDIGPGNHSILT